jgi:hypothetical protein
MNRLLFGVAAIATAISIMCSIELRNTKDENDRLRLNQQALLSDIAIYKTHADTWAASAEVLQLEVSELRSARKHDAEKIKELGIRLRRAESYARSVTLSSHATTLPLRDTIIMYDTVQIFGQQLDHHAIEGILARDSITYRLEMYDTLHQVIHRVPHRFLFFRYGTKAIRQDVWSSNPDTKIIFTEYIELGKLNKER